MTDRITPVSPAPPEQPRSPLGLRVLGAKLTETSGAACAVWQTLSAAELVYEITGKIPLSTESVPHDEIVAMMSRGTIVVAWLFPESDLVEWQARGFGDSDCDYAEYLARVENLRRQAEQAGARLYLVECGVDFMEQARRSRDVSTVAETLHYLFLENFKGA